MYIEYKLEEDIYGWCIFMFKLKRMVEKTY